jgi:hypothetical protein
MSLLTNAADSLQRVQRESAEASLDGSRLAADVEQPGKGPCVHENTSEPGKIDI